MAEQLRNPATIIALTSIGTVGVVSAMVFKRLAEMENNNANMTAHVANFGAMLDKYPTGEGLMNVSEVLAKQQENIKQLSIFYQQLHAENKELHIMLREVLKQMNATGVDIRHVQLQHSIKLDKLGIKEEAPVPERKASLATDILDSAAINRMASARSKPTVPNTNAAQAAVSNLTNPILVHTNTS